MFRHKCVYNCSSNKQQFQNKEEADDAKGFFEQAREAHSAGDFERAAQLYERVISDYQASEEAELSRAHLYNIRQATESGSQSSEATPTTVSHGGGTTQDVVITNIQMPFWSMVVFMVKWAIAAIPAIIILFIIVTMFIVMSGGFLGILDRVLRAG